MSIFHMIYLVWALWWGCYDAVVGGAWRPYQYLQQMNRQFEQKTDRFWEYNEEADKWVEVKLPCDLFTCVDNDCTRVGSILEAAEDDRQNLGQHHSVENSRSSTGEVGVSSSHVVLSQRKRISLTKMSEASVWITGQSGSIYERFWNELQWVIAPHDLPMEAGPAVSVFVVNQTILALSEVGVLYLMHLSESLRPHWVEFTPKFDRSTDEVKEKNSMMTIKSGVVSHDGLTAYFNTNNGMLLELQQIEPPRWANHHRPAGADLAAIADVDYIRKVVYTISSAGNLYEYDTNSKPSWKKHVWKDGTAQTTSLSPAKGCTIHGINGDHTISLFLLTKEGALVERQLQQRKWNWILHGYPEGHNLTSITPFAQDESSDNPRSLFFTTSCGSVVEYQIRKQSGTAQQKKSAEAWSNHLYPLHSKVAKGTPGLHVQPGRILFPLDDGRLAELHLPGLGGDKSGPVATTNFRRRASSIYVWSVLDAPESEGWNAEYCTEERGQKNCVTGNKDEPNEMESARLVSRKKKTNEAQYYLPERSSIGSMEDDSVCPGPADDWISSNFRLRKMHEGRSFFLVTDGGLTFEYLYAENIWLWLRHESSTAMKGLVGNYNGSLFLVDTYGSLFIRERSGDQLSWMNCSSSLTKRRYLVGGAPWDEIADQARRVTPEDALFFVSKCGRLLQLTVSMRKFEWKDCGNPQNTQIASILDQELLRENIVFVTGRDGRLYQYNKVTELWHKHQQSQHLVLSEVLGTSMRPSLNSLIGSLFTLSEEGGLVEYRWDGLDGWSWVEHGTPGKGVTIVGSPGPSFKGNQLLLIGTDGEVYLRYMEKNAWKWKTCGFPVMDSEEQVNEGVKDGEEEIPVDGDSASSDDQNNRLNHNDSDTNCDPKVASTRPIAFSEEYVVFELRDGRLAEMQRVEATEWIWSRIIASPTSLCLSYYWTATAS